VLGKKVPVGKRLMLAGESGEAGRCFAFLVFKNSKERGDASVF
jgi:hypothetical protein